MKGVGGGWEEDIISETWPLTQNKSFKQEVMDKSTNTRAHPILSAFF